MAETWTVALNEGARLQHAIVAGEDGFVSRAQIIAEVEDEENARLIEAAPKMAELLEDLLAMCDDEDMGMHDVRDAIGPVLARIRGEQP